MECYLMAHFGQKDLMLEIARGNIPGQSSVNKYGRAVSGVQVTATDIWDRADAATTQQIWVAPTQARLHNITSTDANDDGDPVGTGARTVKIFGLTGWDTDEVSETVTMNGTSNVATANAYVIIHRMRVVTFGTSAIAVGPNLGVITATAQTDGTVTAEINANEGQTQMAIYGVPSTQIAYMTQYYFSMVDAGGTPATVNAVDCSLLVNPTPDDELTSFIIKHTQGISNSGSSYLLHPFLPYLPIAGPAIIKLQGIADLADTDTSAGFDLILVDN
jgi:hypothetical protein